MDELLDSDFLGTLQKYVSTVHIGVGESVRVTKTQVDVGLRSEMEDGIDIVALQTVHDFGGVCNVAMVEGEVALVLEDARVVQGSAVVELVEGDDIVRVGVGQGEMSYQPACAVFC